MPIGVIINALSVAAGGVIGALFGHKLPAKINSELTKIFGVCSMGMGVSSIGLMKNMPAVILSIILGTVIGLIIHFGKLIQKMGMGMEKVISKVIPGQNKTDEEFQSLWRRTSCSNRFSDDECKGISNSRYDTCNGTCNAAKSSMGNICDAFCFLRTIFLLCRRKGTDIIKM